MQWAVKKGKQKRKKARKKKVTKKQSEGKGREVGETEWFKSVEREIKED